MVGMLTGYAVAIAELKRGEIPAWTVRKVATIFVWAGVGIAAFWGMTRL